MIHFASPEYLYALSGVIVLLVLGVLSYLYRCRQLHNFAPQSEMRELIMPERIGRKRLTRDALILSALTLALIALARPQRVSRDAQQEDQRGIEVMICIDVSRSMLSADIAPSRISYTKRLVSHIIESMPSNRLGLIVFAGNAYIQLPITTDHRAAQEFLSDVSPEMLTAQGTNIGEAITLARSSFSGNTKVGKAIIIITDAEDHEPGAIEAAREAKQANIQVHVVGVGTEAGGVIPTPDGYLHDEHGDIVTTRLNIETGQSIAEAGGGSFITSSREEEVLSLLEKQLSELPRATLGTVDRTGYIELFTPWVLGAFVLLIGEAFISQRRNRLWRRYNIFSHGKK